MTDAVKVTLDLCYTFLQFGKTHKVHNCCLQVHKCIKGSLHGSSMSFILNAGIPMCVKLFLKCLFLSFVSCRYNDANFNVYTQTCTALHTHTYTGMLKVADKHTQAHDYMTDKYTVLTSAHIFNLHCLITKMLRLQLFIEIVLQTGPPELRHPVSWYSLEEYVPTNFPVNNIPFNN